MSTEAKEPATRHGTAKGRNRERDLRTALESRLVAIDEFSWSSISNFRLRV